LQKQFKKLVIIIIIFCLFHPFIYPHKVTGKNVKIIVVKSKDVIQYSEAYEGFKNVLKKEGINFQTKLYSIDKSYKLIAEILKEIIHEKPDLILTIGTKASQEIGQQITELPVVFSMVMNPEAQGLKQNITNPEKNLSGVSLDIPIEIQFKFIRQSLSNLTRIGVLYHPIQDSVLVERARRIARKLGLELIAEKIKYEKDIPAILISIRDKSDLLWLIPNPYTMNYYSLKYTLKFCISNNFPIIGLSEFHVKKGAILALRADYHDLGRQTGFLALEVLRNGFLDDQIVVTPKKIKLFVNKKTAEKIGIEIPITILKQAEQVYE